MINLMRLVEGKYDYGCVMAKIDENSAAKILDFNYKTIHEDLIYKENEEYGREKHPHITLKYGLVNSYNEEEMKQLLHKVSPFNVAVKGVSIFENDKFDVLKFDVDGKELRKLNEMFSMLPNHDEHPIYNPHMTIAYVKKGLGHRFVKETKRVAKVPVNTIMYSDRGVKTYYNL
jgi:2'-5' RNA ligase